MTTAKVAWLGAEIVVRSHPPLKVAWLGAEIVLRHPGPAAPLALRRRPDDNVTGNPVLPRFHGTPQRSSALGAGTSW